MTLLMGEGNICLRTTDQLIDVELSTENIVSNINMFRSVGKGWTR